MRFTDTAQRIEWWAVAAAAIWLYALSQGSWLLFAVLILLPDLAMLGYLAGPRAGAVAYNLAHLAIWPVMLAVAGLAAGEPLLLHVGLVWMVHVAVDRALGYGLKLPTGFRDTHLGRIGRE